MPRASNSNEKTRCAWASERKPPSQLMVPRVANVEWGLADGRNAPPSTSAGSQWPSTGTCSDTCEVEAKGVAEPFEHHIMPRGGKGANHVLRRFSSSCPPRNVERESRRKQREKGSRAIEFEVRRQRSESSSAALLKLVRTSQRRARASVRAGGKMQTAQGVRVSRLSALNEGSRTHGVSARPTQWTRWMLHLCGRCRRGFVVEGRVGHQLFASTLRRRRQSLRF